MLKRNCSFCIIKQNVISKQKKILLGKIKQQHGSF